MGVIFTWDSPCHVAGHGEAQGEADVHGERLSQGVPAEGRLRRRSAAQQLQRTAGS